MLHGEAQPGHLQVLVEVLVEVAVLLEEQVAEDRGIACEAAHAAGGTEK
jgi:hypothetical protein